MTARPKSERSRLPASPMWQRHLTILALGLLLVALSACSTTSVSYPIPPAECSKRVPASVRKPVTGWPLPSTDAARDWMMFGVGESGQRVQANERGTAQIDIIEACEAREREIYAALTKRKKFLGIF